MVDSVGSVTGENMGWTVQSAVSLGNDATTHVDCTDAKLVYIFTSHKLDMGFATAEADSTANDLQLPAGTHCMVVPKGIGDATILNYSRGESETVAVRVTLA